MRLRDYRIQGQVLQLLSKHFADDMRMNKRIRVMADVDKFNPKESEEAWKQKKGITPNYYSVYLDNEFVCSFLETDSVKIFELAFFTRLYELIDQDKINLYQVKTNEEKIDEMAEQIKAAKKQSAATPEEKIAQEATVEILQEKKDARDKRKQKALQSIV